jgi:hypothetical protein
MLFDRRPPVDGDVQTLNPETLFSHSPHRRLELCDERRTTGHAPQPKEAATTDLRPSRTRGQLDRTHISADTRPAAESVAPLRGYLFD